MKNRGYLLDTHCWLWWHIEPERLGKRMINLLEDGTTNVVFSVVSGWEIVIKHSLGKLTLPYPPYEYIPKRLEISYMEVLPIHLEHALQVQRLPNHHKDPFDRLIIAQAIVENLIIISNDSKFQAYDVQVLESSLST